MNKVIIIAEAGVNHNGDIATALKLVESAALSGADYVKFQTFSSKLIATTRASKANYQLSSASDNETQQQLLHRLELSLEDHQRLVAACASNNVSFMSTAFDDTSISLLSTLKPSLWKVPSGEIDNIPYLQRIGSFGQHVLLSTGMSTLADIELAIETLIAAGTPRSQITVLHCTSEYPAPLSDVNLKAIQTIRESFKVNVGYSDHTKGVTVPIAAVALGATVIEKHITLSCDMDGPDHRASLEPDDFAAMVKAIRDVELALGDGIKAPTPSELKNKQLVRKSIVASRFIRKGDLLSLENLTLKRPGIGLPSSLLPSLEGRIATKDYELDDLIEL